MLRSRLIGRVSHHAVCRIQIDVKPLAGVRVCVAELVERRVFQAVRIEETGKSIGDRVRLNVRAALIAAYKRAADAVARFVGVQPVLPGVGNA